MGHPGARGDVHVPAPLERPEAATAALDDDLIVPRLVAEPWYVDRVTIDGARVTAVGWSMPVDAQEPVEGWFRINGRRFDAIRYPTPRPDVGALFWQRRDASRCGFECTIDDLPEPYPNGVLEIERMVDGTPRIAKGRDAWFAPDPALASNLPDEGRRYRVIGDRDARGFLVSGCTDYHRLNRALVEVTGRRLHEFASVLDWGVGCGRVARHFPARDAHALIGCDIDRDNVEWCAAHLPGRFVASRLEPPLPFDADRFDVVYGISVFTHLREPMQLRWLAELARGARRGATLLLTTHGQTAIDFSRLAPDEYRRVCERVRNEGIVVSGTNAQLDGHAEHGGEYVNVYHDADYVRRVWSRYFDVLHVVPGYILHHDLVVLRKR
jgi:2-polyprenyl-3-methyl-5-hydroxy-6-metoxy-1,4-benzoquinol methylase